MTCRARAGPYAIAALLLLFAFEEPTFAQQTTPPSDSTGSEDARTQYPAWLANSYFTVNAGFLRNDFTERQLEPGFHADSIAAPHAAARVVLIGHELTPAVSIQIAYMRPVRFVTYRNVNGGQTGHHVWTGFGAATVKVRAPLGERVSIYGEAGLAIASRHGFNIDGVLAVRDASRAAPFAGGGLEFHAGAAWDLTAGAAYIPSGDGGAEPSALALDGGIRYTMRRLPQDRVEADQRSGFVFPAHVIQIEYSTGSGYSINTALSTKVPVFWEGQVRTDRGLAVHLTRNVFHTARVFSLDLGASASDWRTRNGREGFVTLSTYPLFRFTVLRASRADVYLCYSLAGPTFMSARLLDQRDLGRRFTFQDFMGAGLFLGRDRRLTVGVKINHYSNGNIFPENAGVMVPLTFTIGWTY
jgi:hypothetical protein